MSPEVLAASPDGETSASIALRVQRAYDRQRLRQGVLNAALSGALLEKHAQADRQAMAFLQTACARLGWSGRAFHRVLKLARTIADLAGVDEIRQAHMAEAIQYRRVLQAS